MPDKLLAVYGTLKEGYRLHGWIQGSKLVKKMKLPGIMYLHGRSYPYFFETSDSTEANNPFRKELERMHDIEVYQTDPHTYRAIVAIEESAGYLTKEVQTDIGTAEMFIAPKELYSEKYDTWIEAFNHSLFNNGSN